MSSSPRRAPPQALTMPLLHRQPTPPAHTCLSYASLHPASPSCCPRRSSPRLCSSCASDSSAARPFSCASSHAGSRLYPSSCSAPAASRSHRLPHARPRTRPHCHHPPACSDCGGASPAARLFSCTSFHAGPRLYPPSRSTSIASRTHRSPCPRPRTRPRSHRPPACSASCGSASAAGSLFSWASFRTGPRLCLPSYPAAIANRFHQPSRACPCPPSRNHHLPASSTAIRRSASALLGMSAQAAQLAQSVCLVHVLTLLGGRAPTPQGYINRD